MTWTSYQVKAREEMQLQEQQKIMPPMPLCPLVMNYKPLAKFDEEKFKKKLAILINSKSNIESTVNLCIAYDVQAYIIVRCLEKQIKIVSANQKLTIFYVYHELALKTKKMVDFNMRLGKSIISILPNIIHILPSSTVGKCIRIWRKAHAFRADVLIGVFCLGSELTELNSFLLFPFVGLVYSFMLGVAVDLVS